MTKEFCGFCGKEGSPETPDYGLGFAHIGCFVKASERRPEPRQPGDPYMRRIWKNYAMSRNKKKE